MSPGSSCCSTSSTTACMHGPTASASSTPRFWPRRSARVRFGLTEAHGKGMALQFNYFTG